MRKELKKYNGDRLRFSAIIERFGEKPAYRGFPIPTLLLKNVTLLDTNKVVTDHLWFTKGKSWENFKVGDTIEFDARVTTYEKGYKGYRDDVFDSPIEIDYKLERPTKITLLER